MIWLLVAEILIEHSRIQRAREVHEGECFLVDVHLRWVFSDLRQVLLHLLSSSKELLWTFADCLEQRREFELKHKSNLSLSSHAYHSGSSFNRPVSGEAYFVGRLSKQEQK